jgi:hypothetical protein
MMEVALVNFNAKHRMNRRRQRWRQQECKNKCETTDRRAHPSVVVLKNLQEKSCPRHPLFKTVWNERYWDGPVLRQSMN